MSSYQQVLAGTSLTVTETFSVDGSPIDLDSGLPTLTLTKPDGTAYTPVPTVLSSWAGPPARSAGQYRFVLPAQPDPYYLDYKLVGTIGGQPQTFAGRVEWVGAYLFNLADLRNYQIPGTSDKPFTSTTNYPDAKLHDARRTTLGEFCKRLGFSPVPRFYREIHTATGWRSVVLEQLYPTKILTVTVSGVAALTSGFVVGDGGTLDAVSNYAATNWPAYGYRNVAVEYVAGWETLDGDGEDVALMRAAMKLLPAQSSTMTSYASAEGGAYTWDRAGTRNLAGEKVHFGVGAIAEWINEHAQKGLAVG